jgi:tetratricopeptide (TPR) repeat protein
MQSSSRGRVVFVGLLLFVAASGVAGYFVWQRFHGKLPDSNSAQYKEYVRAFQVGVTALDVAEQSGLARQKFDAAISLIPGEPAAWANRGLLNLRQNDLKNAAADLQHAKSLAPESDEIESLLGFLAERQGDLTKAVAHLRASIAKNTSDVRALEKLADMVSKENQPDSEREYLRLQEKILEIMPNSLPVLARRAASAFRGKDMAALDDTLARLERLAPRWSKLSQDKLKSLRQAAKEQSLDPGALIELDNVLKAEQGYKHDAVMINGEPGKVGSPMRHFLRLPQARPTPAPPDLELAFAVGAWTPARAVPRVDKSRWDIVRLVWQLSEEQRKELHDAGTGGQPAAPIAPAIFVANACEVRRADADAPALPFPGGPKNITPSAAGVLAFDWDNDFLMDLLLAGAGGLRFWHQEPDGSFTDVTAKTGLPAEVLNGDYYGAWAADIEADGDLDVIVARRTGPALVLRNNRDGTFKALDTFAAVRDVRAFVWADLDNDGAPDAIFLDAKGKLHIFANERSGEFQPWPVKDDLGNFVAVTAADVNDDGVFDLIALQTDGKIISISDQDKRKSWRKAELARWPGSSDMPAGVVEIFAQDFDNNGAVDLLVAGPKEAYVFLANGPASFAQRGEGIALHGLTILDLNKDGRLDLLGLSADGKPAQALNQGKKDYHWITLWPLSIRAQGDGRMNTFGHGGDIELRSGTLVQKQLIQPPWVHFGLGEQSGVDLARIVWPHGIPQWEFEDRLRADRIIAADQRLPGSCPFLFTFDGKEMRFAGDFMWGTPLGMYVNGHNPAGFPQTTEWLKIPSDQLVPREGYYDVRVHANLWETDFFDQLALIVVDHPPNTEIYADERFFLTPTPPELFVTTPAKPVCRARDHLGQDATELVSAIDGRYLDRCGRGRFQGVTIDHWVEADLGDDAPTEGPLWLIARGWLHPTDSSINVAIEQGAHDRPSPLVLEVPDGKGGWKVGRPALGFPAGKNKTMLIRLDGIDGPKVSRRFRLRTNMEIFWDYLGYAQPLDVKLAKSQRLVPHTAELRYRGLLVMSQKDQSSPEVPHYDKVMPGVQRWRDLTGYYTRFGDVRELLAKVDDRYVIMNAGDEIAMRFAVPEGPPPGWKRDFIWECDGWTRDGNPNTRFGTTVLPLPAHGPAASERRPGALQDDPVYRRFPEDWRNYHTRYVTSDEFALGLRVPKRP